MKSQFRTMMTASPALLVTMAMILLAGIAIVSSSFIDPGGAYLIAIGFLTFAIVCGSFWVRKSFDVLEPMTLVAITVFIGGTMRSVYIAFLPPSYPSVVFLIGNMRYIDLAVSEATVPIAMLLFVIGYLAWRKRVPIERFRPFRTDVWPTGRTFVSVALMMALGAVSVFILIKAAGISLVDLAT
ncbi:MAG TPA: hypothetical protein VK753_08175, partial [Xanthomonadaceae bacterium]|nr:hypothetical protein [Xanthomonadaceae bacterium]